MTAHTLLSPSRAEQWCACPGSALMQWDVPGTSSEAAHSGRACHELLRGYLEDGVHPAAHSGKLLDTADEGERPHPTRVTADMVEWVLFVGSWVGAYRASLGARSYVRCEYAVTPGAAFGCPDDLRGTLDVVVTSPLEALVLDAKFGHEYVGERENKQVTLYAIGLAERLGYERFPRWRLGIAQPRHDGPLCERVRTEVLSPDQLRQRVEDLRPHVAEARQPDARVIASESACRYCSARGTCRVAQERALELARRDWSDVHSRTISPEELAKLLEAADEVRGALIAVEEHAKRQLSLGRPVPGWKRVAGRPGNRKWKGEEGDVAAALGLLGVDPWKKALVTPAEAGRRLGVKEDALANLVERPGGAPALAPESDPRPALPPDLTKDDAK